MRSQISKDRQKPQNGEGFTFCETTMSCEVIRMKKWQMEGLLTGFSKEKLALPAGHYLHPHHWKEDHPILHHFCEECKHALLEINAWLIRIF